MKDRMFERLKVEVGRRGSHLTFRVFDPIAEDLPNSQRFKQATQAIKYQTRSPVDPDDLVGEFYLGIAVALKKVNPKIGDPVEYLIKSGRRAAQMAVRKECNRKYIQECVACGHKRPYDQRACKCGLKSFILHARFSLFRYETEDILAHESSCAKPIVDGDSDT